MNADSYIERVTDELSAGYFMHSKGSIYVVNYVAICSETKRLRVVYSEVKPDGFSVPGVPSWDRPYEMWNEPVTAASGHVVPRFERILSRHDCSSDTVIAEMRTVRGLDT